MRRLFRPQYFKLNVYNTIYNDLKKIIYAGFRFIGIDFNSFDLFGTSQSLFSAITPNADYRLDNDKKRPRR